MQALYGPSGRPSLPPPLPVAPPPNRLLETQAALPTLLEVLRELVASGKHRGQARHTMVVGARRFSKVPGCPAGHRNCEPVYVGDTWGKGARRQRHVTWAFPAWSFLPYEREESGRDSSSGGGSYTFVRHQLHVAVDGSVFAQEGDGLRRVGDLTEGFSADLVPGATRVPASGAFSHDPPALLSQEIDRIKDLLSGRTAQVAAEATARAADVVVPWVLTELRKRNNPDLQNIHNLGMRPKPAWRISNYSSAPLYLFPDGRLYSPAVDKAPRAAVSGDLRWLLDFARKHSLGEPPG